MKRRLPVVVEKTVADAQAARAQLSASFGTTEVPTSCSKGCSNCCYHPVYLSVLEGVSLFRWLSKHRLWTVALKAKFQEVANQTWGLKPEIWILSLIPCPLLTDKGTCAAYAGRPLACKTLFSLGDPYYCHPHRLGPETGIIDRKSLFMALHAAESKLLRKHYLENIQLPLASAVLYGERISKGELELEELGAELLKRQLSE